jgi:hypothetical protein
MLLYGGGAIVHYGGAPYSCMGVGAMMVDARAAVLVYAAAAIILCGGAGRVLCDGASAYRWCGRVSSGLPEDGGSAFLERGFSPSSRFCITAVLHTESVVRCIRLSTRERGRALAT